ncbi:MAG: LysR family transcriptional regulator [Rhodobacteraceae bacterium]|nr:LysR family transcriptional regulator [Paracoccaceae bacterium]
MQNHRNISLNAIRIFATVAENQSISRAADVLHVTPSAVSHQVKNLEADLGAALFARKSNAISLTTIGRAFLDDVVPGLRILAQATDALTGDTNELTIRVSSTLAVRWLIPALERFRDRYPTARVRFETSRTEQIQVGPSVDLAITYYAIGTASDKGERILTDFSRPVLAPSLLQSVGFNTPADALKIPAITCTTNNWDWRLWTKQFGLAYESMAFAGHFDIDDAALHGATAGLGMVLAPEFMTRAEIAAGTLVELPGFEPVEMGAYHLLNGPRNGGVVRDFRRWLMSELAVNVSETE